MTKHDRKATDIPQGARVAVADVEDAYGIREAAQWDAERGEWRVPSPPTVEVVRNLRGDPLASMRSMNQIDEVMFLAGRHYQKAHELAEVGTVKAIEMKESVDGGCLADPITESQRKALQDIARADAALKKSMGIDGVPLVRDILIGRGEGCLSIAKAADRRGIYNERGRREAGRRFRQSLRVIAKVFGYANAATWEDDEDRV